MLLATFMVWIIMILTVYLTKRLPWRICPVCVGISGTWLVLSAGIAWGFFSADYKLPVAMLMGGTVVGIAFQGEKTFTWARKNIFYWKAAVIILGMPVAYFLFINISPSIVLVELLVMAIIAYFLFLKSKKGDADTEGISELEEKMKNCC